MKTVQEAAEEYVAGWVSEPLVQARAQFDFMMGHSFALEQAGQGYAEVVASLSEDFTMGELYERCRLSMLAEREELLRDFKLLLSEVVESVDNYQLLYSDKCKAQEFFAKYFPDTTKGAM